MRSDMSKVIVERPRYGRSPVGSDYPRGRLKNRWIQDPEHAPRMESMGSARYRDKCLNENLQPLVRYLRSNVGRPWDKVRSEISARISCKSAVQKHVLDHLEDYVKDDVVLDGRAVLARAWRGWEPLVSYGSRIRFYVCPRTKLLRLAPITRRKRRDAEKAAPDRRPLDATRELRRIDGVWYELSLARIGDAAPFDVLHDVHLDASTLARHRPRNDLWRSGRYVASKRQLSSREIVRHGLPRAS